SSRPMSLPIRSAFIAIAERPRPRRSWMSRATRSRSPPPREPKQEPISQNGFVFHAPADSFTACCRNAGHAASPGLIGLRAKLGQVVAQDLRAGRVAQLQHRLRLDLADPL